MTSSNNSSTPAPAAPVAKPTDEDVARAEAIAAANQFHADATEMMHDAGNTAKDGTVYGSAELTDAKLHLDNWFEKFLAHFKKTTPTTNTKKA